VIYTFTKNKCILQCSCGTNRKTFKEDWTTEEGKVVINLFLERHEECK